MIATGRWPVVRMAVWTAGLLVAARLLLAAGSTSLALPVTSSHDLSVWASETPPADMAMALVRLAALAAVFYLLAVTALATLARLFRVRAVIAAADSISPAVVRRVVTGGSGVGLVVGGVVGTLPSPDLAAGPAPSAVAAAPSVSTVTPAPSAATGTRLPHATATMTKVAEPSSSATAPVDGAAIEPSRPGEQHVDTPAEGAGATPADRDDEPAASATMTRLDPDRPDGPSAPDTPAAAVSTVGAGPAALGSDPASAATPAAPAVDSTRWIVEPGDSFWSIAEEVTTAPDGSSADERAVARYWRRLIDANRDRLVDAGNPDLLLPGQQLVVPPPGA